MPDKRVWAYALGAYFGLLALIAFWPSPVDAPVQGQLAITLRWLHAHGVPRWVNYSFVEMAANVVLFIPAGLLGQLTLPRLPWWRITAAGMLISGCIEAGQYLFLPHRFASLTDVLTNTAGALLGAVAARKLAPALPRLLGRVGRRTVRRP
ncbi:VanZ family protein [Pseudarthrobacter sp. L19]|uniref:VanZ family protein n=1 Tax=Pseudarthrobacter sp. L19 TaxID=3423951 RepID=UPI003D798523